MPRDTVGLIPEVPLDFDARQRAKESPRANAAASSQRPERPLLLEFDAADEAAVRVRAARR